MTGNALNVLYPLESQPPNVDVWNFELTRSQTVKAIEDGQVLENDYRGLVFRAQSPESLVFYFKPEGGCLWILGPENVENEYLPFENRDLVVHSDLNTVLNSGEHNPDPTIFGSEPEHDWCYYYEKADLARQLGEWEEVIALIDEAKAKDLAPNFGVEWLPLLEAYSASGQWQYAIELSREIHAMHSLNDAMLCATWQKIMARNSSADAKAAFEEIVNMASCEQN
jgi:tetratricopeptide (TPR) repeat protein